MSAAGSPYNVQWGFESSSTSVVTIGGTSVGMLDGAVTVRVPRTVNFLRADQYAVPIDATVTSKDVFVDFLMKEVLGANLASAWGSGSYASSSVVVTTANQGQVALVIATKGPDACTCTVTVSKAVSVGEGTWTIPFAAAQTIAASFQGVGDMANSGRLIAVVHS